jgi:hypothetical protein
VPKYIFQQSYIWDGAGTCPDPSMPQRKVKMPPSKTMEDAKRKLPRPDLGRNWICVERRGR